MKPLWHLLDAAVASMFVALAIVDVRSAVIGYLVIEVASHLLKAFNAWLAPIVEMAKKNARAS